MIYCNLLKTCIILLCAFALNSSKIYTLDERFLTPAHHLVQKFVALKEYDRSLKSTWSYQGCVIAKAVYKAIREEKSLTAWGFTKTLMGTIAQHNAPQILTRVGSWFVPTSYQETYKAVVDYTVDAFHAYDIYNNPLKQAFGYFYGFMGAAFTRECHKEVQGLLYFWAKEFGYASYDLTHFPEVLPPPLSQAESEVYKEKAVEIEGMDDNILVKTPNKRLTKVLIPKCDDASLRHEAISRFNATVIPPLMRAYHQAKIENKPLKIIFGDEHCSCSCYWQERELLKWAKSFGIKHALFETRKTDLEEIVQEVESLKSLKATIFDIRKSSERYGRIHLMSQVAHAQKLNFTLHPGDPWNDYAIWEFKEYFHHLAQLIDGTNTNEHLTVRGHPIQLDQCPKFFKRERDMFRFLNQINDSSVSFNGAGHLGGFVKLLSNRKNKNDAIFFIASCFVPERYKVLWPISFLLEAWSGRIYHAKLLNKVFGKGCGSQYLQSRQGELYALESPELIRSGERRDIFFTFDIGSYES